MRIFGIMGLLMVGGCVVGGPVTPTPTPPPVEERYPDPPLGGVHPQCRPSAPVQRTITASAGECPPCPGYEAYPCPYPPSGGVPSWGHEGRVLIDPNGDVRWATSGAEWARNVTCAITIRDESGAVAEIVHERTCAGWACCEGDFNGDGRVDLLDWAIFQGIYRGDTGD